MDLMQTNFYSLLGKSIEFWVKVNDVLEIHLISSPEELDSVLKEIAFKRMCLKSYELLNHYSMAEVGLFDRCAEQFGGIT